MPINQFRIPLSRHLLLALVVSLLLHVLLLSGVRLQMPDLLPEQDIINVALVPPAKPRPVETPAAMPKPVKTQTPKPALPKPAPKSVQQKQVELPPTPIQQAAEPVATIPTQPTPPVIPVAQTAPEPPQPPPEPVAAPSPEVEESVAGRGFRHAEIEYRLFRGKGSSIGTAKHTYQAGEDGSYRITSVMEASGLVSLFVRGKYVQQSDGMIGPRGLHPLKFSYQRSDNAAKEQRATFDWEAGTLTLEAGQRRDTVPLLEGAQDQLSFMYQFMFIPPLEQMQLAITNGKKFRVYFYEFMGEETLKTDLGDIRTFHIGKRGNDGEEKTELWLATAYRFLPVVIRQTEKDGTVNEQVIKHIKAE